MQYDEFVHEVQSRAYLGSSGDAVRAIHATLQTLGERILRREAEQLAAQLPREIGYYLHQGTHKANYSLDEFFDRVAAHEGKNLTEAMHHARVVLSVLTEAVSPGEIEDVRAQLPPDLKWLLEPGYGESRYEELAIED